MHDIKMWKKGSQPVPGEYVLYCEGCEPAIEEVDEDFDWEVYSEGCKLKGPLPEIQED